MTILFLCREGNAVREAAGYVAALRRRGIAVQFLPDGTSWNANLAELVMHCPEPPSLILHPESGEPYLPLGLTGVDIPTACFQVDTYAYTTKRIAWSMLFDKVFVFHPGYEEVFRRSGHPGACLLPHAVDGQHFAGPDMERLYEVGWVGQTEGTIYRARGSILAELAKLFRMNDVTRRHSLDEMAHTYRLSKIVINVARDDFPQDANLRAFEAMAAGALLLTRFPTELSALGIQEGVHYVGYREKSEIVPLLRKYLSDRETRENIAEAGRKKVLTEHTYDRRAEMFLKMITGNGQSAPARNWPEARVRLTYLDYFAGNGALACALAELPKIARGNLASAAEGAALLGRAWERKTRRQIRNRMARH